MGLKTGILLINLGTPDAPDTASVRRYLKEFLSDPRVIEKRGLVWWLVLNGIILPRRSGKSAAAYAQIWNTNRDESPLRTITRSQAEKLGQKLAAGSGETVAWAMRYGSPSIQSGVQQLTDAGCDRLLLVPLYPQYSGATTGTALDKVYEALKGMRHQPSLRTLPPYFDDPGYIDAIAGGITGHTASLDWLPEVCLASFHGLPESFIRDGDPYQSHCEATVALLRTKLGLTAKTMPLVYQSRGGGRAVWIGPALEGTLIDLAHSGVRNVSVVTPGFAADCIETLEEVRLRAAKVFLDHGGQNFTMVPCLNDTDAAITLLQHRIAANLSGWR